METFNVTKQLLSVLFIATLFVACSKDDGTDGAVGPQGPPGEQGIAGTNGEDGVDGEDGTDGIDGATGTANVIYSDWIPSEFPVNITDNDALFNIDAPSLTEEIIEQGVVLVYGRTTGIDSDVIPLPTFFAIIGESYYFRLEAIGELQIRVQTNDGSNIGDTIFSDYRYVLIPGGVEASNGLGGITGKSPTNYSTMSYNEICAHFDISL